MSFKDILKKSVIENVANSGFSSQEMVTYLALSVLIGLFIFFVYRMISKEQFFSKPFGVSLVLLSIITTTIIVTIQSNIVISLGMVGALSIVRFRTAIKNPLDLVFAFWAISNGIVTGAGLPLFSIAMSLVITIVLLIFFTIPSGKKKMLVNVQGNFDADEVCTILKENFKKAELKSLNLGENRKNALYEICCADKNACAETVKAVSGVDSVSVIEHSEAHF